MEGRDSIPLGCLHASHTIVCCFSFSCVARFALLWKSKFMAKQKPMTRKPRIHCNLILQNLPIVHKIQGVKMIFFVALFSRLPPSASIFCHFPWAIPKSLCLIISGCGRFFVILHLESAGYAAPAESANPTARKRILNQ